MLYDTLNFVKIEPGSTNMRTRAGEKVGGVLTQDPTGIVATGTSSLSLSSFPVPSNPLSRIIIKLASLLLF